MELSGSIRAVGGALINAASRIPGNATTVSVASNAANLQQAIWFTQNSAGVSTITAPFGSASSLVFDFDTQMILSGGLLSGSVAMNHASSRLELHCLGVELDAGGGFNPIGPGNVNPLSGQLRGTLDSGDPFQVSFTQGGPGRIVIAGSIPVPIPGAVASALGSLLAISGALALQMRSYRAAAGSHATPV